MQFKIGWRGILELAGLFRLRTRTLEVKNCQVVSADDVSSFLNIFVENERTNADLFAVFAKRSENVLFSFFLHKTTKRYSFRQIFAVLSIILRLQKKELNFWETIIYIPQK